MKKNKKSSHQKSPLRSSPSYDEKYPPLEEDELHQKDPFLFKQFDEIDRHNLKNNIQKSVQSLNNSVIGA